MSNFCERHDPHEIHDNCVGRKRWEKGFAPKRILKSLSTMPEPETVQPETVQPGITRPEDISIIQSKKLSFILELDNKRVALKSELEKLDAAIEALRVCEEF